MPFDASRGETIEGFGSFVIVEPRALANLDNLRTSYVTMTGSKFKRRVVKHRSVFDDAVASAIEAFAAAGALRPIRFDEDDVLVQIYPVEKKVAVIFQRSIAGKDHYVTRTYDLPPPLCDDLMSQSRGRPS